MYKKHWSAEKTKAMAEYIELSSARAQAMIVGDQDAELTAARRMHELAPTVLGRPDRTLARYGFSPASASSSNAAAESVADIFARRRAQASAVHDEGVHDRAARAAGPAANVYARRREEAAAARLDGVHDRAAPVAGRSSPIDAESVYARRRQETEHTRAAGTAED